MQCKFIVWWCIEMFLLVRQSYKNVRNKSHTKKESIYKAFNGTFNMSPKFNWQTVIIQSAREDEAQHSFDRPFY